MDPSKESTYAFLDGFIGEMTQLFPDPYFHIGGDEVVARLWNQNDSIQAFAKEHGLKDAAAIQVYFNQRILKIVAEVRQDDGGLGRDPGARPADRCGDSIVARAEVVVGIGGEGVSRHSFVGILSRSSQPGVVPLRRRSAGWAGRRGDSRRSRRRASWAARHACGPNWWAQETVDSRVWPRTAAIAERFWSPANVTDVDSMYTRLAQVSRNLEFTGVMHRAYFEPLLDRIAGDQPARPLYVLAEAVEALGLGSGRQGRPTGLIPTNRFVDAIPPESELARSMELAAKRLVANPSGDSEDAAMLRREFTTWAANDALFEPMADNNKLLAEIVPLSRDLSASGHCGA